MNRNDQNNKRYSRPAVQSTNQMHRKSSQGDNSSRSYHGSGGPSYSQRRKKRKNNISYSFVAIILALAVILTACLLLIDPFSSKKPQNTATESSSEFNGVKTTEETFSNNIPTESTDTPQPDKPDPYTEMTLLCTGDIMYHSPQIEAALNHQTGTYDFTSTYKYIKSLVSSADYAVANFETTLAGESYPYCGYPAFNSPDTALTALASAGFDMMLFANNHCYDTGHHGLIRTQQLFDSVGLDYIGARKSTDGKTYKTIEINGIRIGMLNSTDDLSYGNLSNRTINGITLTPGDIPLIDLFNHSLMAEFYASVSDSIADLKADGADIIVYFIHWGNEYELRHNYMQETIAQELCNLGVDVIIGGHPHVIQDADVLSSQIDPSHKTVCFYSLGNLVSNQNRLTMGDLYNKAYTENGLIVELTIRKYNDGRCIVSNVKTVPLWVHRYHSTEDYSLKYDIVPIEMALNDPTGFGLYNSSFGVSHATEALRMTNATLTGFAEAFNEKIIPYIPS